MDCWKRETGQGISKENFLTVYRYAHLHALTPDLKCTAFRKTGIIPFNRNMILKKAMAPAKETLAEGYLPVVMDPEIQKLADTLQQWSLHDDAPTAEGDGRCVTYRSMGDVQ